METSALLRRRCATSWRQSGFAPASAFALVAMLVCLSGCSTVSTLRSSTLDQGRTSADLVNQMVLDNLARALAEEYALPWHIKITQGAIGITDSTSPSGSYVWPTIARTLSLTGSRQWAVSWTVVPELDFQKLRDLRDFYQRKTHPLDAAFETGKSPPAGVPAGNYRDTYVWVRPGKNREFSDLVIEVLTTAPVSASERGIQLPGVQH
jgi:hypothetical protein